MKASSGRLPLAAALAFASLYIGFGATFGFMTVAVPLILRERGSSLPQIGLLQLVYLPVGLTVLSAMVIDRIRLPWLPHRIGWIVAMQLLTTVLLAVLSGGARWSLPVLFVFAIAVSFCVATMDVALESLVSQTVPTDRRPIVTTIKLCGSAIGGMAGAGLLTMVYDRLGWMSSLLLLAVMNLVAAGPILLYPERRAARAGAAVDARPKETRALVRHVLVLAAYFGSTALLVGFDSLVLQDLSLPLVTVGFISGTLGPVINLAMASIVGPLMLRLRAERLVAAMAGGALAAGLLMLCATLIRSPCLAVAASLIGAMAAAGLAVPVFNIIYAWAQGVRAATDYAAMFGSAFLVALPIRICGPILAGSVGWPCYFALAMAAFAASSCLLITAMRDTIREPAA